MTVADTSAADTSAADSSAAGSSMNADTSAVESSFNADTSASIDADRTIGASSQGWAIPEVSLTTAEGAQDNTAGSYNAGPSPAFPEMSAATLPGTAGMTLEVPSAGWAVYGGDPSRGFGSGRAGNRSRSASRVGRLEGTR